MNQKALQILEYNKILERLAEEASTQDGKRKCLSLSPKTDLSEIELLQTQTEDALSRIFADGSVSFSGARNILASIKHLEVGGALGIEDLLRICTLLEAVSRAKNYGRKKEDQEKGTDSLSEFFELLEPLTGLQDEIRRCILSEDEIADDASSGLKNVRRQMKITGERIHTQMNTLLNGSLRQYLQDAVITMRGDRYCLPVKSEYKNQVPGMIHDQSSTGSTLFIEPASVVKLNNDLRELQLQEQQEILKVLAALSDECRPHTENLTYDYKTMIDLDTIFARAKLALTMNATRPVYNEEGRIHLRSARHPLLDPKKVVPVDIRLGEDYSLLVITGPNTGGKTVSLKTAGLLTLMGQSGLHIPTKDRSELSIFTQVYADIGDEQSIEQSLSTFSSHMKNIVYILKHADEQSLCLFDELCAGTDPTEGAALAIAILRKLHDRDIRTMATTHYSELKVFALSEEGVENGCCEFDVKTLSPTYRLLIGIPGKSNAFAISGKLGLPDDIIEDAKENLSESDLSFEDLMADLEQKRLAIEKERSQMEDFKRQMQSMKDKTARKSEKLDQTREQILEEARAEAREILQSAKATADETIRNFQKYNSIEQIRAMEKDRERLRESIKKAGSKAPAIMPKEPVKAVDPSKLKPGDAVHVLSLNLDGVVKTKPDAKGNVLVQCGILSSQIRVTDLELRDEPVIHTPTMTKTSSGKMKMSKAASVSAEINLIGMKVDEAIPRLDKYLDDAYLSHIPNVRIVHGKGTGALRAAVHQHLKRTSYVAEYRLGEYGEGDVGVTIATFK